MSTGTAFGPHALLAISNASCIVRPSPTAPYKALVNAIAVESDTLHGHPTAYSTTPAPTRSPASPPDSHAFNTHNITRSFIIPSTVPNSSASRAVPFANKQLSSIIERLRSFPCPT